MDKPSLSTKGSKSTIPIKRTRKQKGKSRSGCSRCKIRRVKCDETGPACRNCVKLGFQCPGFEKRLRWSNKHETGPGTSVTSIEDVPEDRRATSHGKGPGPSNSSGPDHVGSNANDGSLEGDLEALPIDADCCGELTFPTGWHPAIPGLDALLLDQDAASQDPAALEAAPIADGQLDLSFGQIPGIFPPLSHLPTMLIEHWFRYVCPMWSAFDSDINFNRQLARSSWTVSGAVFYAMQAMSAACLMDSMPALIATLPTLRTQATTAIKQIIDQGSISMAPKITADLVFAVFALGTSSSWSAPAPMELPWLQVARKLLSTWQVERSPRDGAHHAYFCQALTYWEMLLTTSGLGSMPDKIAMKRQIHQNRLRQALLLPDVAVESPIMFDPRHYVSGTRPNSWCGVSNEVIDTFGQILALCRSARRQQTQPSHCLTMAGTTTALCDIAIAHELQRELLALDFGTLVSIEEAQGFQVHTQDDKTPISDLVLTAEAYRQAGLLQLYLTFVDLPRMPFKGNDIGSTESLFENTSVSGIVNEASRDDFIRFLSLHLLAILDRIPVESGSRSMHSILYLSAAAGLRFDTSSGSQDGAQTSSASVANGLFEESMDDPFGFSIDLGSFDESLLPHSHPGCIFDDPAESASTNPQRSWTIARARQFVLTRLNGLQQSVPQRARDGTLQLVNSLWAAYNAALPGCPSIHWLDLVATGARSVLW